MDEFGRRVNATLKKWMGKELTDALNKIRKDVAQNHKSDFHYIARSLAEVDMVLKNSGSGMDPVTVTELENATLGVLYAIFTGDVYYGTMSALYGKGALVKGATTWVGLQVAAQVLLTGFGVVISWPALLVTSCIMDIVFILTNDHTKQKEKILKTVVKTSRAEFSKDKDNNIKNNVDQVMVAVKQYIDSICNSMDDALESDILQKKALIQATIDEVAKGIEEKDAAIRARNQQVEILDSIIAEADKIRLNYHIEEDHIEENHIEEVIAQ